jgi:NO-binding membrane sensor protein with MHYT domain
VTTVEAPMIVSYDATLVILSITVAIIGSFTGLLIMAQRGVFTNASYKLKIVAGAVTIGSSIWSMHFIGMLALGLPIPVDYDSLITTISVFIAIVLTGLGLYAASSGHISRAMRCQPAAC